LFFQRFAFSPLEGKRLHLVLAVSKVFIAPTFSNVYNFGTKRDTTKKLKSNNGYCNDVAILSRGSLTHLFPFQSYGGFKKNGAINTF